MAKDTYTTIQSAVWDFGNVTTSNEIQTAHQYKAVGKYMLKATIFINDFPLKLEKEIEIFPFERLRQSQNIVQCDSGFGTIFFNLTEIESKAALKPEDYSFTYFEKREYAEIDLNPISDFDNYESNLNSKTLYVKATNKIGCSDIASFTIEIATVNLGTISQMFTCGTINPLTNVSEGIFNLEKK